RSAAKRTTGTGTAGGGGGPLTPRNLPRPAESVPTSRERRQKQGQETAGRTGASGPSGGLLVLSPHRLDLPAGRPQAPCSAGAGGHPGPPVTGREPEGYDPRSRSLAQVFSSVR